MLVVPQKLHDTLENFRSDMRIGIFFSTESLSHKDKLTSPAFLAMVSTSRCKLGSCALRNGKTKLRSGKFVASWRAAWNSSRVIAPA